MDVIGSYEAKTHLPQLLDRVARGERILITKKGKPVGMLVPPAPDQQGYETSEVIRGLREWRDREGPTLGPDLTVRDLVEDGRR